VQGVTEAVSAFRHVFQAIRLPTRQPMGEARTVEVSVQRRFSPGPEGRMLLDPVVPTATMAQPSPRST
jgi:hypothetical protein